MFIALALMGFLIGATGLLIVFDKSFFPPHLDNKKTEWINEYKSCPLKYIIITIFITIGITTIQITTKHYSHNFKRFFRLLSSHKHRNMPPLFPLPNFKELVHCYLLLSNTKPCIKSANTHVCFISRIDKKYF